MVDGSDVYVWGSFDCLNCNSTEGFFKTGSYTEMISHLKRLLNNGLCVPEDAIECLSSERSENGDIY
jgi:hypothetical protein